MRIAVQEQLLSLFSFFSTSLLPSGLFIFKAVLQTGFANIVLTCFPSCVKDHKHKMVKVFTLFFCKSALYYN